MKTKTKTKTKPAKAEKIPMPTTVVKRYKDRIEATRHNVAEINGISLDDLSQMEFNSAYDYLRDVMGADEFGLEMMPQTTQFWGWWRCQWHAIDQEYLVNMAYCAENLNIKYTRRRLQEIYRMYHESIPGNRRLNSAVMEEAYHKLIKEIGKENHQ